MKKILFFGFLSLLAMVVSAQQQIIGTVTDNNNMPIENVEVIAGEQNAFTNSEGTFSILNSLENNKLLFQKEGFYTLEVVISGEIMNVTLSPEEVINYFELSLEELMNIDVVTASKQLQNKNIAPATVIVITEQQIWERNYMSLDDVLNDLPDFNLNKSYGNFGVVMRGVSGNQKFQILIDGMKISSTTNESLPIIANYPVHLAKQIEIVYGPGSALYGADAFAGIINIITHLPESQQLEAKVTTSVGNYGITNNTLYLGKSFQNDIQFFATGQFFYDETPELQEMNTSDTVFDFTSLQTGVFQTAWGEIKPDDAVSSEYGTPLKAYNIYSKLLMNNFSFSVFSNFVQHSSSFGYMPNNAVYNKDVYFAQSINAVSASYTKELENITLTSTLSGNMYRLLPESKFRNIYVNLENGYKFSVSNSIKAEQQINCKIFNNIDFVGGVSFEVINSVPKTADLDAKVDDSRNISGVLSGTLDYYNPEGISDNIIFLHYSNTGVYAQLTYSLKEFLTITAGSRYDYSTNYGNTFNPRLGVVVQPSPKTIIKVLFGTAFFAPRPFDAYEHYGSFSTADSGRTYYSSYWHLPNPELEPIFEKTAELSFKQFIGKNLSVGLTAYHTLISNLYAYINDSDYKNYYNGFYLGYPVDNITVLYNQGEQTITGGNLMLDYSTQFHNGRLDVYSSLSYIGGNIEHRYLDNGGNVITKDVEIEGISPIMMKMGATLSLQKLIFSANFMYVNKTNSYSFQNPTNPNERTYFDGYFIVNASLQYCFFNMLSAFVRVDNLLNTNYKVYGNAAPDAINPINFKGGITYPQRIIVGLKLNLEN